MQTSQARIGIDVVEMKKAKSFYRAHRERFSSAENCAESLAAGEAIFKAYGPYPPQKYSPLVRFIKTKKFVVAHCVGIF